MSIKAEIIKRYPGFTLEAAFDDRGARTGILGASGCGKSLTLRSIAGIETPDEGHIEIDGRVVFDSASRINLPPRLRDVGYLFQSCALFPTMTVAENIRIVLREAERKRNRGFLSRGRGASIEAGIDSLVERFHLRGLERRKPSQLSGGQQQRAALARIFAMDPGALLLDEPFSALDSHLRGSMGAELLELLGDRGGSVLFVSHDRDEIFRVCERMVVLDGGRVVAEGGVREVFDDPGSLAAARLTGSENVARAFPSGESRVTVPDWGLELETGRNVPSAVSHVGIRARHILAADSRASVNLFEGMARATSHDPFTKAECIRVLSHGNGLPERTLLRISDEISEGDNEARWRVFTVDPERVLLLRQ